MPTMRLLTTQLIDGTTVLYNNTGNYDGTYQMTAVLPPPTAPAGGVYQIVGEPRMSNTLFC